MSKAFARSCRWKGVDTGKTRERRRRSRGTTEPTRSAQLWQEQPDGSWQTIAVQVQDNGEHGAGILLGRPLGDGRAVLLEGDGIAGRARGYVAWCTAVSPGLYRAGIALEQGAGQPGNRAGEFDDHYETLEVNPMASADTIHKIYRVLAQRLHPDNPDSGSEEGFKRLVNAFRVLSDPGLRAAFDVERSRAISNRWRIFDPESAAPGLEQEQRKRRGILAMLYNKRVRQPENCGVSIQDLEQLLAVPREHLEFSLWFLKEQGWVQRTDAGKHQITAKGVEHAEATGAWQPPAARNSGLLGAGRAAAAG